MQDAVVPQRVITKQTGNLSTCEQPLAFIVPVKPGRKKERFACISLHCLFRVTIVASSGVHTGEPQEEKPEDHAGAMLRIHGKDFVAGL